MRTPWPSLWSTCLVLVFLVFLGCLSRRIAWEDGQQGRYTAPLTKTRISLPRPGRISWCWGFSRPSDVPRDAYHGEEEGQKGRYTAPLTKTRISLPRPGRISWCWGFSCPSDVPRDAYHGEEGQKGCYTAPLTKTRISLPRPGRIS
ncbi:hypothetical protein K438DRAFT_1879000, partial [Mycena galopus ATCC 62051]